MPPGNDGPGLEGNPGDSRTRDRKGESACEGAVRGLMPANRASSAAFSADVAGEALGRQLVAIVHGLGVLVLLGILAWFVPRFEGLFQRLQQRGELPPLTAFVLLLSRHSYWLLPLGLAVDAAVLYALGRLPRKPWWPMIAWFSLVLIAMAVLYALAILGLLLPVQRMSATI